MLTFFTNRINKIKTRVFINGSSQTQINLKKINRRKIELSFFSSFDRILLRFVLCGEKIDKIMDSYQVENGKLTNDLK